MVSLLHRATIIIYLHDISYSVISHIFSPLTLLEAETEYTACEKYPSPTTSKGCFNSLWQITSEKIIYDHCSSLVSMPLKIQCDSIPEQQQQQQLFYGPLSRSTRVSWYQKKHSPTNHPDHHSTFISFFYLLQSIASSLFKLRAWQYFCTTSVHVLFGLPLGLVFKCKHIYTFDTGE